MKLFVVGPKWMGQWTEGVQRAAKTLGHEPETFYYYHAGDSGRLKNAATRSLHPALQKVLRRLANRLEGARAAWQNSSMNRRLLTAARLFQPDAILVLKGESLSRETLSALRSMAVPFATWWVDDPFRYPVLMDHFRLYDAVFVFDRESASRLVREGARRVTYLPCACDPTVFRPQRLDPFAYPQLHCTVGLVATFYPGRADLLKEMKGLDLGLWGGGWWQAAEDLRDLTPGYWRAHRISPEEACLVYNLALVCPNVHHPQTRLGGLNSRTFEIPAAGGFELVDQVAGLEEHFLLGSEMIAYSSPTHFRDLADYFLAHPAEREAIAQRGRARVLGDHTYAERLRVIFKTLGVE